MEFAISQPKVVWLPRNKKQTYRLNSRTQMWPMGLTLAMTLTFEFSRSNVILTIWWPRSGIRIYQIATGETSDVGVPSTLLVQKWNSSNCYQCEYFCLKKMLALKISCAWYIINIWKIPSWYLKLLFITHLKWCICEMHMHLSFLATVVQKNIIYVSGCYTKKYYLFCYFFISSISSNFGGRMVFLPGGNFRGSFRKFPGLEEM